MSVKGDLVAALTTRGMTDDQARQLLTFILLHAADPNFAYAYADEQTQAEKRGTTVHNDEMRAYWRVIDFLKLKV